jgi:phosphoribosylanthranilate isomerase
VYVKICGLTHPEHVAAAVEAGADAIGLVLAASPRRVDPDRAARLLEGVPAAVERFAVFRVPELDVLAAVAALPFTAIQHDAAWVGAAPPGWARVPAYANGPDLLERVGPRATGPRWVDGLVVVDGPGDAGAGVVGDWARAAACAARGPLMLAGGLSPENVADAIRAVRPAAVDVSSGVERTRGLKDPERVAAFVRAARGALG